jgi:hypothetical protein
MRVGESRIRPPGLRGDCWLHKPYWSEYNSASSTAKSAGTIVPGSHLNSYSIDHIQLRLEETCRKASF